MKVGRFYGIDVHVHWSFWLLIAIYLVSVARSGGLAEGLIAVTFILSVFLCVLLHEYGHAIAARRFGIRTLDITLMPIGGLARLERMPDKPMQEFYVAIAGPLVNVAIAVILFLVKALDLITAPAAPTVDFGSNFVGQLMVVNVGLVLFNMLPAFPMDGGRVLRSLLAIKLGQMRATSIAARVGRWMALVFAIWAIFVDWNPMLLLLAGFIFITGTIELFQVKMRTMQEQSNFNASFQQSYQWRTPENQGSSGPSGNSEVIDAIDYKQIR